ncbi:MAG: UDP-3-O-(3-hydroxymyristoyl)glucosamine N-acyltransferase [Rickettsiales bacterium]|nr:UDP-3-O-(3-hydroxymyristoyl)glucosamine N-acyltransferase [Rickettsiales bacterium]
MIDSNFYNKAGPFTIEQVAEKLSCDFSGNKDFKIFDISTLENAKENEISFLSNKKYLNKVESTKAGALILEKKYINKKIKNYLFSNNPYFLLAELASLMYPDSIYPNFYCDNDDALHKFDDSVNISKSAFVHKTAKIGKGCNIGHNSVIGKGVIIGNNCIIGDNVSIYFSMISDNVKLYQGVKLGGEGFGFAIKDKSFKKIPQLGRVIIKKNVEIGCNSTVDRGSIGDTVIEENSMIDNMVHLGHNVKIGRNCIIAAMTGISGSCNIGNNVMIGGQVGISGHVNVGNNVKIAAKSGVMKNIEDNLSVGGYPAESLISWHRGTLLLKNKLKK